MKRWMSATVLCLCSLSAAAAGTPPVSVSSGPAVIMGMRFTKVYITARTNSVVIKKIRVNRGNCRDAESGNPWRPVRLSFGNTLDRIYASCNILEIGVETDQGEWTFNTSR